MIVQKAFKYRFFPTDEQAAQLARTFGCSRYVYNHALDYRSKAWQEEKKSLDYHDTALKLTEWKKEPEKAFLSEVSSVVLQQSLRNLDTAFTNFFEKRAQYPKFKSRRHRQSVRYATNAFTFRDDRIILAKQSEPLDIVWSRSLPDDAKILNLTISRDTSGRYFVSILVETEIKPLRKSRAEVGIDVGIKTLATTSDGEKIENPRPLVKNEKRLRILQRRLSRKVKDSNNRTKARFRVARLHAKISDARRNMLQKFTTKIIRENQAIFVEGLNVAGMLKYPNLAKHIGDAAFAEIFRELEYKAKWYGRIYQPLDRFFPSSKLCSSCGYLLDELPLSIREWDCPACGIHHDRDINAAINIKLAGQYLLKWLKTTGWDARKVTPMKLRLRRCCSAALALILMSLSALGVIAQTHRFTPKVGHPTFAKREPVLRIKPGDIVETNTLWGDWYERAGGAWPGEVGPFYMEGATPNDTLVVKILKLRPNRDTAISTHSPGFSALATDRRTPMLNDPIPAKRFIWKLNRESNTGILDLPNSRMKRIEVELKPMLGRVAVAPQGEEAWGGLWPGDFGGNMDASDVCEGATVYLPVFHDGAFFYFGDGHALQGDGEVCGSGLETSMDVTFQFDLIKGKRIRWPRIENGEYIMATGSVRPLMDAFRIAQIELIDWLVNDYGFEKWEAFQVVSQVGVTRVANAVDPNYTIVAKFPKKYLPKN